MIDWKPLSTISSKICAHPKIPQSSKSSEVPKTWAPGKLKKSMTREMLVLKVYLGPIMQQISQHLTRIAEWPFNFSAINRSQPLSSPIEETRWAFNRCRTFRWGNRRRERSWWIKHCLPRQLRTTLRSKRAPIIEESASLGAKTCKINNLIAATRLLPASSF